MPSGYGSISYLGKGRKNPYCVRPPVTEFDINGKAIRPKPICYTDTWIHGFMALTAWKSGTYTPGMEAEFPSACVDPSDAARRIMADYLRISKRTDGITFSEAYAEAYEWKSSHKQLSKETKDAYAQGFRRCAVIHNTPLVELKTKDLQKVIDDCNLSYSVKSHIKNIMNMVYKYAVANDIVKTDYSKSVIVEKTEQKHGQAFSAEELRYILNNLDNDNNKRILIMCLSGYRISAYRNLEINLEEKYFRGGVKTAASKDRIVPIHSAIYPYVKELVERDGGLEIYANTQKMVHAFHKVNPEATPHWARHTFSALCERFSVRENDRKRMLGHSVGDITNDIYGHRTLEDLRTEIEKIDVQNLVQQ